MAFYSAPACLQRSLFSELFSTSVCVVDMTIIEPSRRYQIFYLDLPTDGRTPGTAHYVPEFAFTKAIDYRAYDELLAEVEELRMKVRAREGIHDIEPSDTVHYGEV